MSRGIKGRIVKLEPTDLYGEYYPVLENVSLLPEETCVEKLVDLYESCLVGTPVVVRLKETMHDTEKLQNVMKLCEAKCQNIRNEL